MIPLDFLEGGFHIGYKTKGDDESSMENTWVVKDGRNLQITDTRSCQINSLAQYFSVFSVQES